jgi:outer membrane receptor protein involved in Fe transport
MASKFNASLLCTAAVVALTTGSAYAQDSVEQVTVTGSRVISDITLSPTPLTVVTAEQLQQTTPTNVPDALNKLPVFIGGRTPRSQDNGSRNQSGNVLALRNFGASRTLILLDGHRVAPTNFDGTVDIDTLPQMLMSRVDVVTGGASAVYGSDAVAGVVNFVLDKNFSGFKYNVNAGISKYSDAGRWQAGMAWGTELFGGRGHFEMAAKYENQDMIPIEARPYAANNNTWVQAGNGAANNPFVSVPNGHLFNQSQAGTINCGTGNTCALNNYTFNDPGSIRPMIRGVPTGTTNLESGGDGGYQRGGTFRSALRTYETFMRTSYDLNDTTNVFIQGSWAESKNFASWSPFTISSASGRPNGFFTDNAFLTPAVQQQLAAAAALGRNCAFLGNCPPAVNGVTPPHTGPIGNTLAPNQLGVSSVGGGVVPASAAGKTFFTAPSYVPQKVDGAPAYNSRSMYNTISTQRALSIQAGATGTLMDKFNWDVNYTHGESRQKVRNPHNTDNSRLLAAEDAVIAPAGTTVNGVSVAGTVQCYVTTVPAFQALYPGCVPMNLFDPDRGISQESWNWTTRSTAWILTQQLDDLSGSISGPLGFGLPAGEITGALSGEVRWATYDMQTDAIPTEFVNCNGLRMCLQNGTTQTLQTAPVRWTQNVNAPVSVGNNVYEFAAEFNVPLLKDVPLIQDLSLNAAGRYTNYSTSGEAQTWKVGIDWHVNETVRFRGTTSVDIRAPNLNDLFQPVGISSTGFTDLLTTGNNSTRLQTQGNPALIPEVARTYTAGMVLTPDFIPGLVFSIDYFQTHLSSAIQLISGQGTQIQQQCIASAPAYDNPLCGLYVRPIAPGQPGFTSTANYPIVVLSSPLNASTQQIEGWDIEVDYSFELADLMEELPGTVNFRHLLSYQPVNTTVQFPGAAPSWQVNPKTRQTTFLNYTVGDWGLSLQNQWLSGFKKNNAAITTGANNYAVPRVGSYNVLDVTIDRKFDLWGGESSMYFTINNIGDTRAPLFPTNGSNPGLFYPTAGFHDDTGRFFTIGLKGNL